MKDPRRLLDEGTSATERMLLESAAFEEPPPDGAERLRVALGLTASVIAGGAASAAQAAAKAAPGAAGGSAAKLGGAKVIALWVTAASTVAVLGATLLSPRTATPTKRRAPHTHVETAVADQEPEPALPSAQGGAAQTPTDTASVQPVERKPRPPAARSIADETAQLDEARRALWAHETARALKILDQYEREHQSGVLAQEATMLRIEVLASAGQTERARRLGTRFLRDHPKSPHRDRVRALRDGLRAE